MKFGKGAFFMMQMGKSMPCLYEEKLAVPAMASAQQSGSEFSASCPQWICSLEHETKGKAQ